MPQIYNRKNLKPIRKSLRNNSTSSESTLWKALKNRQVGGLKFRRQQSVGNYIVDFYCPEFKLAIELDGEFHAEPAILAHDFEKEEYLNKFAITVLRYENRWVFEYPEVIIRDILEFKEKFIRIIPPPPSKP